MKKLNRKGFTLIELLAVIVILAIVLVVTIPNVINSMNSARQKSFENAVETIRDYVQKNYDICNLGADFLNTGDYDSSIFTSGTCTPGTGATIIAAAGYSTTDISEITVSVDNDKVSVTSATAGTSGKFKGATYSAS